MNIDKKALIGIITEIEASRERKRIALAAERSALIEAEVLGFSRLQIMLEIVKARVARRFVAPEKPTSWVYFAKVVGEDLVKIGISITPDARMDSLRVKNKRQFELLGLIEGDETEEYVIHAVLNHHRDWVSGLPEVFSYSPVKGVVETMIQTNMAITERPQ